MGRCAWCPATLSNMLGHGLGGSGHAAGKGGHAGVCQRATGQESQGGYGAEPMGQPAGAGSTLCLLVSVLIFFLWQH